MVPVEGLVHERHDRGAPAAEEDRRDRHAGGVLPLGRDRRAPGAGAVKRVFGWAAGVPDAGRPVVALPVDEVRGRLVGEALPPDVAVVGEGDVGEDGVGLTACASRSGSSGAGARARRRKSRPRG